MTAEEEAGGQYGTGANRRHSLGPALHSSGPEAQPHRGVVEAPPADGAENLHPAPTGGSLGLQAFAHAVHLPGHVSPPPCTCPAQLSLPPGHLPRGSKSRWEAAPQGLGSELRAGPGSQASPDPVAQLHAGRWGAERGRIQTCSSGSACPSWPSPQSTLQTKQRFCCPENNICKVPGTTL